MIRLLIAVLALGLAGDPAVAGARLLVVTKKNQSLVCFDAASYTKLFSVVVPGLPHQVVASPDGKFAYLADYDGNQQALAIVDLERKTLADTVRFKPLFKPHGLALTRDGQTLFATCEGSRAIAVVDLPSRKVVRKLELNADNSHLLALSPDERTLFVTSSFEGNVCMVNVASGIVNYAVKTGKGAEGVDVSPDGRELWVANAVIQNIAVVDVKSHQRTAVLSCGYNPLRVKFSPDGKTAVVTCAQKGELVFFDTATRQELTRVAAGVFPSEIAFDDRGARCFMTDSSTGEVVVVDTAARKVAKRFAVGPDPEGIAFVP